MDEYRCDNYTYEIFYVSYNGLISAFAYLLIVWHQEQPLFNFKQWIAEFCWFLGSNTLNSIYVSLHHTWEKNTVVIKIFEWANVFIRKWLKHLSFSAFNKISFVNSNHQNFDCHTNNVVAKRRISFRVRFPVKTINENVSVKFKNPQSSRLYVNSCIAFVRFAHV